MPCLALSDTPRRVSNHSGLALSNTSSFSHHCLFSIDVLGCTGTADKFCAVDQETLKQNLIRLVAVRSGDNWLKAINTDFEIK
jgi:hypothetical protein